MKAIVAVKAVLFDRERKRLLIIKRSSNDPSAPDSWENAGGKIEEGESPEEALKREIYEETGISEVDIGKISYAAMLYGSEPLMIAAYICHAKEENVTLSREHSEYLWADADDCRKLLPPEIISDFENNGIFGMFA